MSEDFIDYGKLIDEAMHIIVQKALKAVANQGLKGDHHFFISFITNYPSVVLSDRLRQKYPNEMTIVLQYQYENLVVEHDAFSVTLSFDNIKENIRVPFNALTAFADPSVKFGLQFRHIGASEDDDDEEILAEVKEFITPDPSIAQNDTTAKTAKDKDLSKKKKGDSPKKKGKKSSNVVELDNFRKK